jgi:hypothetical protein
METEAKIYKITIDKKKFDLHNQFITGAQLKALVNAPSNYGVWLKMKGPEQDKEIADNETVDLAQPGREDFFTGPKQTTEGYYVPARS